MTTINKEDKIIYIHIPKCAGSSIEKIDWLGGAGHVTYKHLQHKFNMHDYFVFTSIRDPLDRLVSAYFHFVQYPLKKDESEKDQDCYRSIKEHHSKYKDRELEGFLEFVSSFFVELMRTINHFRKQVFFLKDKNGVVRESTHILKVENLQNDFNRICEELGKERIELPRAKISTHLPYQKYYTDEKIKNKVLELYKEDVELYNKN